MDQKTLRKFRRPTLRELENQLMRYKDGLIAALETADLARTKIAVTEAEIERYKYPERHTEEG